MEESKRTPPEGGVAGSSPEDLRTIKVVCVGDGGVGKTCTLLTYTTGVFPTEYIPSVFENYSAQVQYQGALVSLGLWDTGGSEEHDRLTLLSYPGTDVLLVCFSLTSRRSFDRVKTRWLPEITHHCPGVPFVLAGNKLDLLSGDSDDSRRALQTLAEQKTQPVSHQEARKMAKEIGAEDYISYSALTQENLSSVFDLCVKAAMRAGGPAAQERRRGGCVLS